MEKLAKIGRGSARPSWLVCGRVANAGCMPCAGEACADGEFEGAAEWLLLLEPHESGESGSEQGPSRGRFATAPNGILSSVPPDSG